MYHFYHHLRIYILFIDTNIKKYIILKHSQFNKKSIFILLNVLFELSHQQNLCCLSKEKDTCRVFLICLVLLSILKLVNRFCFAFIDDQGRIDKHISNNELK